jgi:hypothetical protein
MTIVAELQEYLGNNYDPRLMVWNDAKLRREMTAARTMRQWLNSKAAVHYHACKAKDAWILPHIQFAHENLAPGMSVLDYHARAGEFGLGLREGYRLSFADSKGRLMTFLKQRVKTRGLDAKVYDVDKDNIPPHDAVMAFDAVPLYEPGEQWVFIQRLATLGRRVIINIDKRNLEMDGFTYPVDWTQLMDKIAQEYHVIVAKESNYYVNLLAFVGNADTVED